jgi:hypothetical protein
MNEQAIREEIAKIVVNTQKKFSRQYPAAKKQLTQLRELNIAHLMPARYGHSDAQAVLWAATNAGGEVGGFSGYYGDGDVTGMPAAKLYQLLNE